MRPIRWIVFVSAALAAGNAARAEDYKIEPLKEAPPKALAEAVRATLTSEGYRVLDGQGKPLAEVWL
jgi:hypothetical protein